MRLLRASEPALLPPKKQRLIENLRWTVNRYLRQVNALIEPERAELLHDLRHIADPDEQHATDYYALASWWMDVIRPEWNQLNRGGRQHTPFRRLRDLRRVLKEAPIGTERLASIRSVGLNARPIEVRIVAVIMGVQVQLPESAQ